MTTLNMCPEARDGAHCDELEGHKPVLVNGLRWEHFDHHAGRGWNANGTWVSGPPSPRSFEVELMGALPAHTWYHTNGFDWNAVFTTAAGEWLVARLDKGERGHLVAISGPTLEFKAFDAPPELVIAVLRLRGALDEPIDVSPAARRLLASQLFEHITECARRLNADGTMMTTHDEAHLNGMSAAVTWLRGELGLPAPRNENVVMAELVRDAWHLIRTAHGGQPWDAHGTWRDQATAWRNAFRLNKNPSAELLEAASGLIRDVVGNQGDEWEATAGLWIRRYDAWDKARS